MYKYLIVFIGFCEIVVSCRQTKRLSKEDYSWLPYFGNEQLIFRSSLGTFDTIKILKRDTMIAYPEAQAINGRTYELVRAFAQQAENENDFVLVAREKDGNTKLHIYLFIDEAVFYDQGTHIKELKAQPPLNISINKSNYDDVYLLLPSDSDYYRYRVDYVSKVYWSKSKGLIKFEKSDGTYWELE